MENTQLLNVLKREGVLINVSIRFWRGCKKLKAEDIGLNAADLSDRLISLGHKRLLPKEALSELALIEGRAHALIESSTFPFLNGLAHFLPNAKLEEVTAKLTVLGQEFSNAKKEFLSRYSTLRTTASTEWRQMAEKLTADPELVVTSIEQSFPLPQKMDRYYSFDTQLFQISLPEKLSMELITTEEQQQVMVYSSELICGASSGLKRGETGQMVEMVRGQSGVVVW